MKKVLVIFIGLVMFSNGYSQNRRSTTTAPVVKKEAPKEDKNEVKDSKDKKRSVPKETKKEDSKTDDTETSSSSKEYAGKPFLSPRSDAWKLSTVVEFGALPSDADITTINIYGLLGLNFDIARRFHIGPYFRHKILSTHEYQVIKYNNIDYDVSSLKEWGTGITVGAYFPIGSAILLDPELRIGYNEFTIQHPQYSDVTTNFIYRNYVNFTPRLNIGMKISEYAIFNVHGGYTLPYFLSNPEPVPHYNPSSFHYGLGLRFYLMK